MDDWKQKEKAFQNVLDGLDYDRGITIGSYVGLLKKQLHRYEKELEESQGMDCTNSIPWTEDFEDERLIYYAVRYEEMKREKEHMAKNLQEIKKTILETPYREYTSNKIRYRLLRMAKEGLHERE